MLKRLAIPLLFLTQTALATLDKQETKDIKKWLALSYEEKMEQLNRNIALLQGEHADIGSYRTLKTEAKLFNSEADNEKVSVQKMEETDNCFLGIGLEVYDENDKLLLTEEGPVNLRRDVTLTALPKTKGLWPLRIETERGKTRLTYYRRQSERDRAQSLLEDLANKCQYRSKIFFNHYEEELKARFPKEPKPLVLQESTELGARPVRYLKDDKTQRAALLSTGHDAFSARLAIAAQASKPGDEILVQYLIFIADEGGLRLGTELIDKAGQGVKVQVILDALSPFFDVRDITNRRNTKYMYNNMMAAGIPVHGFRCYKFGAPEHALLDQFFKGVGLGQKTYDQRPHEKLWIVNRKQAIIGGMNIGNDYFQLNKKGFGFWRDQDMLIEGKDLIQDMVNIFEANAKTYAANYLDPRQDFCFNPYDPTTQRAQYEEFKAENSWDYDLDRSGEDAEVQEHANSLIAELEDAIRSGAFAKSLHWAPLESARVVQSRPKLQELLIEQAYLDMIDAAREEIIISNAYLMPSYEIRQALRRAAERGARIYIMSNSYDTNDIPPVAMIARHGYRDLADPINSQDKHVHPLEIYEWVGKTQGEEKLSMGMNHAKYIVVDRKLAFVGSYNLDPRSRNINSEVGLSFTSSNDALAKELAKNFFEQDLQYARPVPYRKMLRYRQPLEMLEALVKQMAGVKTDESLIKHGLQYIFFSIAKSHEETW